MRAPVTGAALRAPALLVRSVAYEFRKRIQFRAGFLVREVLNGTVEPLVMLFVYTALYRSAGQAAEGGASAALGGWTYAEIVRYVAGLVVVRKLVFHNRGLDLATEIFEGRVTKYLVMPFRFFVLLQGRFVQFTLLQLGIAGLVWGLVWRRSARLVVVRWPLRISMRSGVIWVGWVYPAAWVSCLISCRSVVR